MNRYIFMLLSLVALSTADLNTTFTLSKGFTFKKIFFILLENQPLHVAMDDTAMSALAVKGTLLTNLHAITNPSQPNYIGLISGDLMGVHNDTHHNVTGRCLVDLMEENHVSWKAYQENYPSECFTGDTHDGLYKRKHNPFMSYSQVRDNATVCSHIVNSDQLYEDIKTDSLPQYSFYTPNMDNNGHDTSMRYAAAWLEGFLTPLLSEPNFMKDMLVVVTFDEGVPGDNIIYTVLFGDDAPAGKIDTTKYSLYSLLRLVQDQYSLPTLGRSDETAPQIQTSNFKTGKYVNLRRIVIVVSSVAAVVVGSALAGAAYFVYRKRRTHASISSLLSRKSKLKSSDFVVEENA